MADDGIRWGYAESTDTEQWSGSFSSREEAIEAAREAYGDNEVFYLSMGRKPSPAEYLPAVDWLLDDMRERANDAVGDLAEDFAEVSKEAEVELEKLLEAWAEKHLKVDFWIAEGDPEEVRPEGT